MIETIMISLFLTIVFWIITMFISTILLNMYLEYLDEYLVMGIYNIIGIISFIYFLILMLVFLI